MYEYTKLFTDDLNAFAHNYNKITMANCTRYFLLSKYGMQTHENQFRLTIFLGITLFLRVVAHVADNPMPGSTINFREFSPKTPIITQIYFWTLLIYFWAEIDLFLDRESIYEYLINTIGLLTNFL